MLKPFLKKLQPHFTPTHPEILVCSTVETLGSEKSRECCRRQHGAVPSHYLRRQRATPCPPKQHSQSGVSHGYNVQVPDSKASLILAKIGEKARPGWNRRQEG